MMDREAGARAQERLQNVFLQPILFPDVCSSFLSRAAAAGYSALVITLDTWSLGWRPRDLDNGYLPFNNGDGLATYFSDPAFHAARSDEALKKAVLEGGLAIGNSRDMPAWRGFFDDAELEVLVKRLRAFAAERGAK